MKKRILCLILAVVMLIGSLGVLTACGGNKDPKDPCANGHTNTNKTGVCEVCGQTIKHTHTDTDDDGKCDVCSKDMSGTAGGGEEEGDEWETGAKEVTWKDDDPIELFFMMTNNSESQQNPSGCQRYLAGEDTTASGDIDTLISDRNSDAEYYTNVKITYDYYDDTTDYGWGSCIEVMFANVSSGATDVPDMYCNFTYDMVGASLKGTFANLKNTELDSGNYFTFLEEDYDESVDNRGYMMEYMESMTLSQHKMYVLASDYFLDLIRSFFIVPVNISLLESVGKDITGDLDGDGKFTIDDFYDEVWENKWTYNKVIAYSAAVYKNTGTSNVAEDIEDVLGFAIAEGGLAPSGIVYSTNITVIKKEWNEEKNDYDYSYPTSSPDLVELFQNIKTLVNSKGVAYITSADSNVLKYGADARVAVRNRFSDNKVLFGGVIVLAAIEYEAYQKLNKNGAGGFAVVPVPLYHEVEEGSSETYLTSIHNNARPGAIARSTKHFSACTAFLDYQSTHSTDILNEYYDYNLTYDTAGGSADTVKMLQYIRTNVRSAFDKTFEDAIGVYNKLEHIRWHQILSTNAYDYDNIAKDYSTYRNQKETKLQELYNEYPKLP